MRPPDVLAARMPQLATATPDDIAAIAAARKLDPTDPATVWAAATVHPWTVDHDSAWWLTCVASWPTPAYAIVARATPKPRIPIVEGWDQTRLDIDRDTFARLQQILDDETAALLKRLGVNVMAAAKDPKLKQALGALPLDEVWAAASSTFVNQNPKTITAALGADDERELQRALERAEQKARRVIEQAEERANAALAAIIAGATELADRTTRIDNAMTVLRGRFANYLRRILDPRGDRDPDDQIGETGASGVTPPGIGRDILNAAGGADLSPEGRSSIDDSGRPLRNGIPGRPGHASSQLTDNQFDTELRRIGRNLTTPDAVREYLADGYRDIAALARALVNNRLEMAPQFVWRRGNPPNPFDPHVPLDGTVQGSEDWERLSKAGFTRELKNGDVRTVRPWSGARWWPGDHNGCQCEWVARTVPTLTLGGPEPTRTADDVIIDGLLGASL